MLLSKHSFPVHLMNAAATSEQRISANFMRRLMRTAHQNANVYNHVAGVDLPGWKEVERSLWGIGRELRIDREVKKGGRIQERHRENKARKGGNSVGVGEDANTK